MKAFWRSLRSMYCRVDPAVAAMSYVTSTKSGAMVLMLEVIFENLHCFVSVNYLHVYPVVAKSA